MRVTDALIRQNKAKNKKNYNEDDEPTQSYKEKTLEWWSLNRNKSVFTSPMDNGINNRESVFDSKAVFRTKEG